MMLTRMVCNQVAANMKRVENVKPELTMKLKKHLRSGHRMVETVTIFY